MFIYEIANLADFAFFENVAAQLKQQKQKRQGF